MLRANTVTSCMAHLSLPSPTPLKQGLQAGVQLLSGWHWKGRCSRRQPPHLLQAPVQARSKVKQILHCLMTGIAAYVDAALNTDTTSPWPLLRTCAQNTQGRNHRAHEIDVLWVCSAAIHAPLCIHQCEVDQSGRWLGAQDARLSPLEFCDRHCQTSSMCVLKILMTSVRPRTSVKDLARAHHLVEACQVRSA